MNLARILFRSLLLTTFAMWFGGFFFYVSFVVPIGTEVLESSFGQGMITRRVTMPLNYLCGAATVLMLLESVATWRRSSAPRKQIKLSASLLVLICLVCLFVLHPQIDAFVDLDAGDIRGNYQQFYFLHRIYLWSSTIQWVAAIVWLICYAAEPSTRAAEPPG